MTRLSFKEPPRSWVKGQSSLGVKLIPREAENFQDLKSKLLMFNIYSFSFSLLSPFTPSSKKKSGNPFDIWLEILARLHTQFTSYIFYFPHNCRWQCCQTFSHYTSKIPSRPSSNHTFLTSLYAVAGRLLSV